MQFGLFYQLQLPRPWHEEDEYQLFQQALEQVELADRLGIDFVWVAEHHFLEEYSHSSAPEVFLAACSQRTKHIRLGHGIALMPSAYNHPIRVTERIATLDLVSGGRVEWGTGSSSSRLELEGFNINPKEKYAMWTEAVREATKMISANPYAGFTGNYFSMPPRNILPKPVQKPHPPLWISCANRDSILLAAKLGLGALTFAFIDPHEAKQWVAEYYTTFKNECEPLGRTVNPNIAVVTGFMCHEDCNVAVERGMEGFQFFAHALSHYYITGTHVSGQFNIWEDFQKNRLQERRAISGIGNPDQVRMHLEMLEESGVDQVVFIMQSGKNRHEHICASLELFAARVLPDFKERHADRRQQKAEALALYIEQAMHRIPPLPKLESVPPISSYPVLSKKAAKQDDDQPDSKPDVLSLLGADTKGQ